MRWQNETAPLTSGRRSATRRRRRDTGWARTAVRAPSQYAAARTNRARFGVLGSGVAVASRSELPLSSLPAHAPVTRLRGTREVGGLRVCQRVVCQADTAAALSCCAAWCACSPAAAAAVGSLHFACIPLLHAQPAPDGPTSPISAAREKRVILNLGEPAGILALRVTLALWARPSVSCCCQQLERAEAGRVEAR